MLSEASGRPATLKVGDVLRVADFETLALVLQDVSAADVQRAFRAGDFTRFTLPQLQTIAQHLRMTCDVGCTATHMAAAAAAAGGAPLKTCTAHHTKAELVAALPVALQLPYPGTRTARPPLERDASTVVPRAAVARARSLAQQACDAGRWSEAVTHYDTALSYSASAAAAAAGLAHLHVVGGVGAGAGGSAGAAAADSLLHHWRGDALMQCGRWREAIDAFTQALARPSGFESTALKTRGAAYVALQQWDAALNDLNATIGMSSIPDAQALALRAAAHRATGAHTLSLHDLFVALRVDSDPVRLRERVAELRDATPHGPRLPPPPGLHTSGADAATAAADRKAKTDELGPLGAVAAATAATGTAAATIAAAMGTFKRVATTFAGALSASARNAEPLTLDDALRTGDWFSTSHWCDVVLSNLPDGNPLSGWLYGYYMARGLALRALYPDQPMPAVSAFTSAVHCLTGSGYDGTTDGGPGGTACMLARGYIERALVLAAYQHRITPDNPASAAAIGDLTAAITALIASPLCHAAADADAAAASVATPNAAAATSAAAAAVATPVPEAGTAAAAAATPSASFANGHQLLLAPGAVTTPTPANHNSDHANHGHDHGGSVTTPASVGGAGASSPASLSTAVSSNGPSKPQPQRSAANAASAVVGPYPLLLLALRLRGEQWQMRGDGARAAADFAALSDGVAQKQNHSHTLAHNKPTPAPAPTPTPAPTPGGTAAAAAAGASVVVPDGATLTLSAADASSKGDAVMVATPPPPSAAAATAAHPHLYPQQHVGTKRSAADAAVTPVAAVVGAATPTDAVLSMTSSASLATGRAGAGGDAADGGPAAKRLKASASPPRAAGTPVAAGSRAIATDPLPVQLLTMSSADGPADLRRVLHAAADALSSRLCCVVCGTAPRAILLEPCGHVVCCAACARDPSSSSAAASASHGLRACPLPLCRVPITARRPALFT